MDANHTADELVALTSIVIQPITDDEDYVALDLKQILNVKTKTEDIKFEETKLEVPTLDNDGVEHKFVVASPSELEDKFKVEWDELEGIQNSHVSTNCPNIKCNSDESEQHGWEYHGFPLFKEDMEKTSNKQLLQDNTIQQLSNTPCKWDIGNGRLSFHQLRWKEDSNSKLNIVQVRSLMKNEDAFKLEAAEGISTPVSTWTFPYQHSVIETSVATEDNWLKQEPPPNDSEQLQWSDDKIFSNHGDCNNHHYEPDTAERRFQCQVCKRGYTTFRYLKEHERVHSGEKPHHCEICDKSFHRYSSLAEHRTIHSDVKPFECLICAKSFKTSTRLKRHTATHAGERPFECLACGKRYCTKYYLFIHSATHTGEKRFPCTVCEERFPTRHSLEKHRDAMHPCSEVHQCPECHRQFAQRRHLVRHKRSHGPTGGKPYSCTICDRHFAAKYSLQIHYRWHTGAKPFQCSKCSKGFTCSSHLSRHMSVHSDAKPFQCSVCKKKFARKDYLNSHQVVHSSETPFYCTICEKPFKHKSTLVSHVKQLHPMKNEPVEFELD